MKRRKFSRLIVGAAGILVTGIPQTQELPETVPIEVPSQSSLKIRDVFTIEGYYKPDYVTRTYTNQLQKFKVIKITLI